MPKPKDIKTICANCGKRIIPYKKAVIFGTKKWDGHTYKLTCDCLKNVKLSIG